KVQVLSGGEKSRVALARMLVRPANLMLLDEPTNHLDISSQEVLQEAMAQYEGTIIVVSHNRYFVNSFVNKVLEIRNGKAALYLGNVDDYLERRREKEDAAAQAPASNGDNDAASMPAKDRKAVRRQRALLREKRARKMNPLKEKVRQEERQIESLEKRKKELEQMMADPDLYGDQLKWSELSREYTSVQRRLERHLAQWEEAQEQIEAMETPENE
ncbi:MAG: ATP-binding cassette domain-containing protein, partial [Desulfobulbaceae bacterium]|nr:ATP-binding cassette domain-containing protein [Desulfobulbaceae bacterium]